jgi:hypothetical protein
MRILNSFHIQFMKTTTYLFASLLAVSIAVSACGKKEATPETTMDTTTAAPAAPATPTTDTMAPPSTPAPTSTPAPAADSTSMKKDTAAH